MGPTNRQSVFAGVLLLANRMQTTFDGELPDLTLKQWLALTVIAHLPQPVASTAVVADALGTTHQNVSKLVAALASAGFVELTPSPDDRRARRIALTASAHAYFAAHAGQGEQVLDRLFAGTTDADVAACLRVLDTMARQLTGETLMPKEDL
ncbi:MarR family transcriptional regulator [Propioniciclava sp. MC1595]|uniref:MarR family winged helix-turn-helix transcriptional regulator n=1 Tax=Propioniciclava sp. MC1595 TaxID=2760308 RepID=UPI00166289F1|nr:MarR family transcriptional regulator [Propioniciclava sp. MC1595]MBB1494139.1 MarR family transcriptional regulator [Propioniciclava sp. MC1595]QTE25124.1 MarR family transcriptional regulator [Propioniciclava sp. MC1595]